MPTPFMDDPTFTHRFDTDDLGLKALRSALDEAANEEEDDDAAQIAEPNASDLNLASLIREQHKLVFKLQKKAERLSDVEDLKAVATACSSIITSSHRTGELVKDLETYQLLVQVFVEFLKRRSDALGEDLLAQLREVADELGARQRISRVI